MKSTPTSISDREPPAAPEPAPPADATLVLKATPAPTVPPAQPVVPPMTSLTAANPPAPVPRATHLRAFALAGAAVLVIAALALPRRPSAPSTDADAAGSQTKPQEQAAGLAGQSLQPSTLRVAPIAVDVTAASAGAPDVASGPSKKALVPKPKKNRIADSTKSGAPIAAMTPVADMPIEDATAKLPGAEAIALPPPPPVSTGTGGSAPVTITGCLEVSVNHDEFRLTDTEGADAPRSRSWRSGFLRKRSAPVALVDVPDRLALQTHVGRRVAATGLLTSRDLKVSALRIVGSPCN